MTAPHAAVTLETLLVRSSEVLFQEVGGEAVLLDLSGEQYFGLDQVGTRIWHLIDGHAPLRDIHGTLSEEYDAEPDRTAEDLLALGQALVDAGVATVR